MRRTNILFLLFVASIFNGCVSQMRQLSTEDLSNNIHRRVWVETKDGRLLEFFAGDYHINGNAHVIVVDKGNLFVNRDSRSVRRFTGEIPFDEIEKISSVEANTASTIVLVSWMGITGFLILASIMSNMDVITE